MFCNRCGKNLPDKTNFCTNCGYNLTNTHENQFNYSYNYSRSDEDYKKAYIGNNYEKIKERKFSLPAFIFGSYYLFYRKLWLYAIILFILNICIILFTEYNFIIIPIYLFIGIKFNDFYLNTVDKKVKKIKNENSSKTSTEIVDICRKKGGVSVLSVIIIFIICFLYGFIMGFTYIFNELIKEFNYTEIQNNYNNNTDSNIEELEYNIPIGFTNINNKTPNYKYYNYNDDMNYCTITIESNAYTNLYKTAEEYLKSHTYTNQNDQVSTITNKNINNKTWSFLEVTSKTRKQYKYTTIHNNKIYYIDYKIYRDENNDCFEKYEELINSFKFINTNNSV